MSVDGGPGGTAEDAASSARRDGAALCDPSLPFGTPQALPPRIGEQFVVAGQLTPDELTMIYTRAGTNCAYDSGSIVFVKRPSRESAFADVSLLSQDSGRCLGPVASMTGDGLMLFIVSLQKWQSIYVSRRPSIDQRFDHFTQAGVTFRSGDQSDPFVLPDASALYYVDGQIGGHTDIFRARLVNGTPIGGDPLPVIDQDDTPEEAPVLTPDELSLYFYSERVEGAGIFRTTRAKSDQPFAAPVLVPGLDHAEPRWISPDECRLYFAKSSGAFVATRSP